MAWMKDILAFSQRGALEYSFTSNFIWRKIYKLSAARFEDRLVVLSNKEEPSFIFPAGKGPIEPLVQALYAYTKDIGKPLVFNTVLNEDAEALEKSFPGKFAIVKNRKDFDYIYEAERLMSLSGKKLSGKRNHINRFHIEHPNWAYEAITPENIGDAHAMSLEWCKQAGCQDEVSLFDESCAVEQAFKHYDELGLSGGVLRAGGRVVAFAMGEPLTKDTYVVHIEKAFSEIRGAYQMINQQFAQANFEGYQFVNREDDAGEPGLRKAKLSYDPLKLLEKSSAVLMGAL